MEKRDLPIIVLLFALLFAWPLVYRHFLASPPGPPRETEAVAPAAEGQAPGATAPAGAAREEPDKEPSLSASERAAVPATAPASDVADADTARPPASSEPAPAPVPAPSSLPPEQRVTLTNEQLRLTFSSHGGGLIAAELIKYPESLLDEEALVTLDFSALPALGYVGLPGLSQADPFELALTHAGITISRESETGLRLTREIRFDGNYRLQVTDRLANAGPAPLVIPAHEMQVGPMGMVQTRARRMGGLAFLGVDAALSTGVRHWGRAKFLSGNDTLHKLFQEEQRRAGCAMFKPKMQHPLPAEIRASQPAADWVAVKNKFFTQILVPETTAAGYTLRAKRLVHPSEQKDQRRTWAKMPLIEEVSATLRFSQQVLDAGDRVARRFEYYVGPKKYSVLRKLGKRQEEVMNFGMWAPVCKILLTGLNWIYGVIPNYGLAIILLTVLIRVVFWPITHKNSEHMRRMQEVQPLIKEIQAKYKDNPKKLQQETMAVYKEHKVNPVGGCLPMMIQIPVFIALFRVLQSAVELRFAAFLWVRDLSEPEGLLAGVLPFPPGGLNILPLFMAGTMALQQRLTPTAGDPNQKKMMMFMPLMMLFFFYSMPSALVLYWSTNQCLMIAQLLVQRRRRAQAGDAG